MVGRNSLCWVTYRPSCMTSSTTIAFGLSMSNMCEASTMCRGSSGQVTFSESAKLLWTALYQTLSLSKKIKAAYGTLKIFAACAEHCVVECYCNEEAELE